VGLSDQNLRRPGGTIRYRTMAAEVLSLPSAQQPELLAAGYVCGSGSTHNRSGLVTRGKSPCIPYTISLHSRITMRSDSPGAGTSDTTHARHTTGRRAIPSPLVARPPSDPAARKSSRHTRPEIHKLWTPMPPGRPFRATQICTLTLLTPRATTAPPSSVTFTKQRIDIIPSSDVGN